MSQDPSPYDLLQDARIEGVEEIVHPYYQPPSETEHSFPVVGQGVTSEMYQQMSLAQGDGVLITDDSEFSYRLEGMPGGAAETNSTNRMVLKVSQNTGRSEAILRGFYHVLYQDMQIELPPVTTPTTYIIALTYDPRREEEENGPIRVEVHQNNLPHTHGRKHILLKTVQRNPNQLLSESTTETYRHHVAPTIVAREKDTLPNATDVLYGTLGITRSRTAGSSVIPGTGGIYEARGIHGWHNLLVGPWEQCTDMRSSWRGNAYARHSFGSIDLYASIQPQDGSPGTLSEQDMELFRLPASMRPERLTRFQVTPTGPSRMRDFYVDTEGWVRNSFTENSRYSWIRFNVSIPSE